MSLVLTELGVVLLMMLIVAVALVIYSCDTLRQSISSPTLIVATLVAGVFSFFVFCQECTTELYSDNGAAHILDVGDSSVVLMAIAVTFALEVAIYFAVAQKLTKNWRELVIEVVAQSVPLIILYLVDAEQRERIGISSGAALTALFSLPIVFMFLMQVVLKLFQEEESNRTRVALLKSFVTLFSTVNYLCITRLTYYWFTGTKIETLEVLEFARTVFGSDKLEWIVMCIGLLIGLITLILGLILTKEQKVTLADAIKQNYQVVVNGNLLMWSTAAEVDFDFFSEVLVSPVEKLIYCNGEKEVSK